MEGPKIESTGDGLVKVSFGRASFTLSAGDLAACEAEMCSTEQAEFFADLARRFAGMKGALGPDFQMHMIGEDLGTADGGSCAVRLLRTVLDSAEESLVNKVMDS